MRFEFDIPVVATNLLIEYAAFHEAGVSGTEKLQCPRCSRTVADKHGICKHCGDNAYQCRHCRNINYEKLDAFLCNECGFCKHARFDFTLTVKPSYVVERVSCEAERVKLIELIEAELSNANARHAQLASLKKCAPPLHPPLYPPLSTLLSNLLSTLLSTLLSDLLSTLLSTLHTLARTHTPDPHPQASREADGRGRRLGRGHASGRAGRRAGRHTAFARRLPRRAPFLRPQ